MGGFEGRLVCRSCGRSRPESDFTTGLKCTSCSIRDAAHKQKTMELKLARAETRRADSIRAWRAPTKPRPWK
jgi:hypothetical protein